MADSYLATPPKATKAKGGNERSDDDDDDNDDIHAREVVE